MIGSILVRTVEVGVGVGVGFLVNRLFRRKKPESKPVEVKKPEPVTLAGCRTFQELRDKYPEATVRVVVTAPKKCGRQQVQLSRVVLAAITK